MRTAAFAFLAIVTGLTGACQKPEGYVQLEAVVDITEGAMEGALRWAFWDGDPRKKQQPGLDCEIWEDLVGEEVDMEPALCPDCISLYHLDAAPSETDCDAAPESRELVFGFAPIDSSDLNLKDYEKEGYPLLVRCDWDPHEQRLDHLAPLFVAELEGSGNAGSMPDGTYLLESIYLWESE